jgi:phosphonate transport system substrate-binding protein
MPSLAAVALLIVTTLLNSLPAAAETLRIGSIADEYVAEVSRFLPLTSYLQPRLKPLGYDQVEIVITNSMEQMGEQLAAGEIDLFIDSPYPAIVVSDHSGSQMVLRRWKKGVEQYRSVIFVRADSPYQQIGDLKGQRIAFEEPFSTASYFLGKL